MVTPTGHETWTRTATIGIYGGDPNKENCTTEVDAYAWKWYRAFQGMRGSAYSTETGTQVHAENLALARMFGNVFSRLPEKIRNNATPGRSDEKLDQWVQILNVTVSSKDERWRIREKCRAKYRILLGPTQPVVREVVQELLGDTFVDITFQTGSDLANPPTLTFWPGINPGPSSYDLGGGAWLSERMHYFIQVSKPAGSARADFLQLMNTDLFQTLDPLLPAYATFDWSVLGGFLLDISELDFSGLTD